jgi:hypothetical protein
MFAQLKCACCPGTPELFKVKDDLWVRAGFPLGTVVCISCFERVLGRALTVPDLDLSFPWWGTPRPDYYQGITDGIAGEGTSLLKPHPEYSLGFALGRRIRKSGNS